MARRAHDTNIQILAVCPASSGNLEMRIKHKGAKKLLPDVLYALTVLERHHVVVLVWAANTGKACFSKVLDESSVEYPDE